MTAQNAEMKLQSGKESALLVGLGIQSWRDLQTQLNRILQKVHLAEFQGYQGLKRSTK